VLSAAVKPERFSVEGLRDSISETLALLGSSAGLALKPLVPRDPTGEMLAVIEQMRPPEGPPLAEGVWASPDGKRALLIARTRASGSDTDAQAQAVAAVEEAFRKIGGEKIVMTGPGVFSVRARAMVEHDVVRLTTLSGLLVVALLLVVYRSPRALALGFIPVVSGAIAGVAAVSLGFGAVHGITLGFGTTLIGEAVDYSIYLFVQAEDGRGAGDGAWIERFWPTIRLGVLTSIAGFSALLLSGLPGLAQLGLYSIAGLVAAAAVTRFVLPQLLPRGFRVRDLSPLGRKLAAACRHAARLRWVVAVFAVAALAVLAVQRATLWDNELLQPQSDHARGSRARLADARGARRVGCTHDGGGARARRGRGAARGRGDRRAARSPRRIGQARRLRKPGALPAERSHAARAPRRHSGRGDAAHTAARRARGVAAARRAPRAVHRGRGASAHARLGSRAIR
jgi:predicted exporter